MTELFSKQEVELRELSESIGEVIDLFICSASYESRCLSIPMHLDKAKVEKAVILQNENVMGNGPENSLFLQELFGDKATKITISKKQTLKTGDEIIKLLAPFSQATHFNCFVDITCLTHEALLVLFIVIREMLPRTANVQFLYTPAKEYDPGNEKSLKWLSKGLSGVRSILGYPGELMPSLKNELVVLVGFEVERTVKLIEAFEPHYLSFGLGLDEPVNEEHKVINEQKHKRLSLLHPNAKSFIFSPTNPYFVRNKILELAAEKTDRNIIVSPMNTKLSTLGVALAVFANPRIQICYAPAAIYNVHNYSTPRDVCYLFELDPGER